MALKQINRKSNSDLVKTVTELKKAARENDAPLWKSIALKLESPSRNWPSVNISKLEFNVDKNSKVLVPGKLLGAGNITNWAQSLPGELNSIIKSDSGKLT